MDGRFDERPILEKAAPHGQAGLQAPGSVLVSVRTAGGATSKHSLITGWLAGWRWRIFGEKRLNYFGCSEEQNQVVNNRLSNHRERGDRQSKLDNSLHFYQKNKRDLKSFSVTS